MARYLGLRGRKLQSVISLVCGLGFLCFGYAQGVMGGLLTVPAFLDEFPQLDTISNNSLYNARVQGAVVGTWNLGCFVSAIWTIFIGDYLGRKNTLMMGLTLWIVGEIIQSSSYSFGQFIAGRAIAGFGNGFTTATFPAYQAECVKSHRKGTILMISTGAFIAFGLALSYWLVFAFAYLSNISAAWRVPIAFQIVFALPVLALLPFLPESPRWLILTGREDEALRVLSALNDEDIEGPEIRDEFLQIKDAILTMAKGSASSLTSNKGRRNAHRIVLAYFVQVFQQISGINLALQYLALMMYSMFSYSGWLSRLLGACAASFYFLMSFITVVGIDRFWGRRWLMMFGAAGMCLCMVLLSILGYLWEDHSVHGTNVAQTVFLFGFLGFFAVGWQGMAWLYQVEIVPLRIRGPANALSTSANWLINFVVVFIAPIAFHNIRWRTYIIFAVFNAAILPLVYFFYPETAYRSLEEVDVLFHLANQAPGNPWLSVVKISKHEPLWNGRHGEKDFKYEDSEWHRRLASETSSGSRASLRGNAPQGNRESNGSWETKRREDRESRTAFAGSTASQDDEKHRRPKPPSCDSITGRNGRPRNKEARDSSTSGTTAVSQYSNRPPLPSNKQHSYASNASRSMHSLHSDPDWSASAMAPPPLSVPSRNSVAHSSLDRMSTDYPSGFTQSESGRLTYLPDGLEDEPFERYLPDSLEAEVRAVLGRGGVVLDEGEGVVVRPGVGMGTGTRSSSMSHYVARDAGRGH